MQLEVYNTYATHGDNETMHFDVLMPQGSSAHQARLNAADWLRRIGVLDHQFRLDSCQLCHVEEATPEYARDIKQQGYAILQMEGCPAPIF